MQRQDPGLLKVVNASGYLLQLRLEEEVRRLGSSSRWQIFPSEHHWWHPESQSAGFIDLIVGYGIVRLVIECKRQRDGSWVFLCPRGFGGTPRFRGYWSERVAGGPYLASWDDFVVDPSSPQAMFCTLRGQGDKDQPMLERIADSLLESVEALATEELQLGKPGQMPDRRIYLPVIVTTAELEVCSFDVGSVDLATGTLPDAEFETVPCVRFRKSLAHLPRTVTAEDLHRASLQKERTVLVVQAKAFSDVLNDWNVRPPIAEEWPFTVARRSAETRD
jgi:hypothetical protein